MSLPAILTIALGILLFAVLVVVLIKQNVSGGLPTESRAGQRAMGRGIAIGYAIGMGPGLAIGVALDNIGMGIAIGGGMGISIGIAIGAALKKKEEEKLGDTIRTPLSAEVKRTKFVAILAILLGVLLLAWLFYSKLN